MAESNVRTPLISDTDDICDDSCQVIEKTVNDESITELSSVNLSVTCKFSPTTNAGDNLNCVEVEGEEFDTSQPDIICIFVVAFDTRAGKFTIFHYELL